MNQPTELFLLDSFSIISTVCLISSMLSLSQYLKQRDKFNADNAAHGAYLTDMMTHHILVSQIKTHVVAKSIGGDDNNNDPDMYIPSPRSPLVCFLNNEVIEMGANQDGGIPLTPNVVFFKCVDKVNQKLLQCLEDQDIVVGIAIYHKIMKWFEYIKYSLDCGHYLRSADVSDLRERISGQFNHFHSIDPSRLGGGSDFYHFSPDVLLIGTISYVVHHLIETVHRLYVDDSPDFHEYNTKKIIFELGIGRFLSHVLQYHDFTEYNEETAVPYLHRLPYSVLTKKFFSHRTRILSPVDLLVHTIQETKIRALNYHIHPNSTPHEIESGCVDFLEGLPYYIRIPDEHIKSKNRRAQFNLRQKQASTAGRTYTPNWQPCFDLLVFMFGENVSKLLPHPKCPRSMGQITFGAQHEV